MRSRASATVFGTGWRIRQEFQASRRAANRLGDLRGLSDSSFALRAHSSTCNAPKPWTAIRGTARLSVRSSSCASRCSLGGSFAEQFEGAPKMGARLGMSRSSDAAQAGATPILDRPIVRPACVKWCARISGCVSTISGNALRATCRYARAVPGVGCAAGCCRQHPARAHA